MYKIGLVLQCAAVLLIAKTYFIVSARAISIAKSFEAYKVVPDVISKAPGKLATVKYPSGVEVSEGNVLTPTQVKDIPTVSWDAAPDQYYTVAMTDPDAGSRQWHHWLVGNIPGDNMANGRTLAKYVGSGPPEGTGLHRYVFLVYKQPGKLTFDEPSLAERPGENRAMFTITQFAKKYNLGDPVAGNFYRAEYDDYVPILYKQLGY